MQALSDKLTVKRLKEILLYNPNSGVFVWRVAPCRSVQAGQVAGRLSNRGYIQIGISCRVYSAHRLAWFYTYGVWPAKDLDHKDRNKQNNAICNIREASQSENKANVEMHRDNTSGVKGVSWDSQRQKWRAQIGFRGKYMYLGLFNSKDNAAAAYRAKAIKLFGKFAHA